MKKRKLKKEWKIIFSFIAILLIFVGGYSYSRYTKDVNVNIEDTTGKLICNLEVDDTIYISNKGYAYFKVTIKNYDENENITNTDIKYQLEIKNKEGATVTGSYRWLDQYGYSNDVFEEVATTREYEFTKNGKETHLINVEVKTEQDKSEKVDYELNLTCTQKDIVNVAIIYDKSGNNYTATLKNGAEIKRDGNGDKYLSLEGTNSYAQLPTLPATIDFESGFTIEFKAKWDSFNNWSRVFDFGNGSSNDNIIVANKSEALYFASRNGIDSVAKDVLLLSKPNLKEINEFKIDVIKSGDIYIIKTYQNGQLASTVETQKKPFRNAERKNNYIGKSNWASDGYFDGRIYYLKITQADGKPIIWYEF